MATSTKIQNLATSTRALIDTKLVEIREVAGSPVPNTHHIDQLCQEVTRLQGKVQGLELALAILVTASTEE